MKRNLVFAFVLIITSSVIVPAQELMPGNRFSETEQATYRLYLEKKWDSLIAAGKTGRREGLDYYYLHARLGRAYFETGRYRQAVKAFRQALKHNAADAFSQEYLYYALLYSGQNTAADAVAGKMPHGMQKQLFNKSLPFFLAFEAGPLLSDGRQKAQKANMPENGHYAETRLPADGYYLHTGAGFRVGRGSGLYAGFSQTGLEYHQRAFLADSTLFRKQLPFRANEVFLQWSWAPETKWEIVPALKFARNSISRGIVNYSSQTNQYLFTTDTSRYNDWLGSLTLVYKPGLFSISLNTTMFEIFDSLALQTGISAVFYPRGNLNLLIKTGFIFNHSQGIDNLAASFDIGGKISKGVWAEAGIMTGDLRNLALNGGMVVYNTGYMISTRAGFLLLIQLSQHLRLSANYQFLACHDKLYVLQLPNLWESQNVYFTKHTITGGIKWTL